MGLYHNGMDVTVGSVEHDILSDEELKIAMASSGLENFGSANPVGSC
jgi:hypothetical protein